MNKEHSNLCKCDIGEPVQELLVDDEFITGYNGLLAGLPETSKLRDEINGMIIEAGGLEAACQKYPYKDMELCRDGVFRPIQGETYGRYTNLFHVMLAKRKFEQDTMKKIPGMFLNEDQARQQRAMLQNKAPNIKKAVTVTVPKNNGGAYYYEEDGEEYVGFNPIITDGFRSYRATSYNRTPSTDTKQNQHSDVQQPSSYPGCFLSGNVIPEKSDNIEDFKVEVVYGKLREELENDDGEDAGEMYSFSSKQLKTEEEERKDEYKFTGENLDKFGPIDESIANAKLGMHPNDPAVYANIANQNHFVPGVGQTAAPIVKSARRIELEKAGLHPKSVEEINANIGLSRTSGGEQCFSLDTLKRQKAEQNTAKMQREAECEAERQRVRMQLSKLNQPGWTPNHPILKTAEFPDGISENHPAFSRVKAQIANSCFSTDETEFAHSETNKFAKGIFNPANPYTYSHANNEPSDEEVEKMLVDKQFGERSANFNGRPLSALNIPGSRSLYSGPVTPTPTSQMNWNQGLNGVRSAYQNGASRSYGYNPNDRSWLYATEEEIKSGKVPIAKVVYSDDDDYVNPICSYNSNKKKDFKVFVGEDCESKEQSAPAMDYKEAAVYKKSIDDEEDTYALAKELSRYNQVGGDTLLWYKEYGDFSEFIQVKKESQAQLIRYRNADKLSSAKSTVIIAGERTIVHKAKPMTIEELESLAKQEEKRNEKVSDEDIVRSKYRNPVNKQMHAVFDDGSMDTKLKRLQALRNIRVVSCADDKLMVAMDKKIANLQPLLKSEYDNYITWKSICRKTCPMEQRDTFDKDFDKWWNVPKLSEKEQKQKRWDKYVDDMTARSQIRYMEMSKYQLTDEQKRAAYNKEIIRRFREFDEGSVRDDMTLNEFLDNWGFLKTRIMEIEIAKETQNLRKLYDPDAYLQEVRRHSALRNFQDGKGYVPTMDLMDKGEYQRKRQAFIDSIWKKANRGTIT